MHTMTATVTLDILSGPDYYRDEDGWEHNAYTLRLKIGGPNFPDREMETPWKQGLGITDDPNAKDVLESLVLDAQGMRDTFEEWAEDYGYDTDSRKAEATYNAVREQTRKLLLFLGVNLSQEMEESEAEDFVARLAS